MHKVDIIKNRVKISFDKEIRWWQEDKRNFRNQCAVMFFDRGATMYIPLNAQCIQNVWAYAVARKGMYCLTDEFCEAVPEIIDKEKKNKEKLALLQSRVTLNTIDSRPRLISHFDPQPFKHQRVGLEYAVRFPGFYTLDEMGLGKTRIAIERYWFLKEKLGKTDKSLVICPISLFHSWSNEIKEWSNFTPLILRGTKNKKLDLLNTKADFYIINYEGVNSILKELLKFVDGRTNIILDEYIKIKNNKARQTKQAIKLCDKTDYVHALCGTPITQGPGDAFAPSLAVDKGRYFGFSENKFLGKYFYWMDYVKVPKPNTATIVSNKIYQNAIRFLKKDCTDLPEQRFQTIELDIGKNKKNYDEMVKYSLTIIDNDQKVTAPIILVQILRLSQITSGFVKTEKGIVPFDYQPKMQAVEELFSNNFSHQFVIWSRFTYDVTRIAELCIKLGLTYGCLLGQADNVRDIYVPKPGKERVEVLKKFKEEKIQVMIGTTKTGGMGINELARAERVVYYSNDYSYLNREQSQKRTNRTGSVNSCLYYDLTIKNTIDVSILKILKGKKNVADIVTRDNLNALIQGGI